VVIAVNIEYRSAPDEIRMSEINPHVRKRSPIGPPRNSIPVQERRQSVRMPLCESEQRRPADHAHF